MSALPHFLFLHLLLLFVPSGETIRCFECIWYEKEPVLRISAEKSEACSPQAFNGLQTRQEAYSNDYACATTDVYTGGVRTVILSGAPMPENIDQGCIETSDINQGVKSTRKTCICLEDLCNTFPSAGYRAALALGTAIFASLLFLLQNLA